MQPAISLLEKTPRLLETMLCDLPGELLHWKPVPERWSISEVLAHLSALSASARTGVHSELGTITLGELLNEWANHDLGHIRQIAELYRARSFILTRGPS
jgi:hypothetical protein